MKAKQAKRPTMPLRIAIDAQAAKRPDIREHVAKLVGEAAQEAYTRLCRRHFPTSGTAIVVEADLQVWVVVEGVGA